MKTKRKQRVQRQRWMLFSNGAVHGVQHTDMVLLESVPNRSITHSTVSVVTLSRSFGVLVAVGILILILLVAGGCQQLPTQKGGRASSTYTGPDRTNAVLLVQSDNPKEPSRQTVQSEQVLEYVLPPGSEFSVGSAPPAVIGGSGEVRGPGQRQTVTVSRPVPVRMMSKDRTETSIGAAQRDAIREWAGQAANLHPVMWAGIAMMTLVAGALVYFGWYTKAAVAEAVGIGMIVLAQLLPDRGMIIFLGGIGTFAFIALLVLYSYYKGLWDQNRNGIPDLLEKERAAGK